MGSWTQPKNQKTRKSWEFSSNSKKTSSEQLAAFGLIIKAFALGEKTGADEGLEDLVEALECVAEMEQNGSEEKWVAHVG